MWLELKFFKQPHLGNSCKSSDSDSASKHLHVSPFSFDIPYHPTLDDINLTAVLLTGRNRLDFSNWRLLPFVGRCASLSAISAELVAGVSTRKRKLQFFSIRNCTRTSSSTFTGLSLSSEAQAAEYWIMQIHLKANKAYTEFSLFISTYTST